MPARPELPPATLLVQSEQAPQVSSSASIASSQSLSTSSSQTS